MTHFFLRLLARLPLRFWHAVGALGGRLAYRFNARYAKRLADNLRQSGIAADTADYQRAPDAEEPPAGAEFSLSDGKKIV